MSNWREKAITWMWAIMGVIWVFAPETGKPLHAIDIFFLFASAVSWVLIAGDFLMWAWKKKNGQAQTNQP